MKEFVKESIVKRWGGSMHKMNERMQDTVVNALMLSKVTALPLYLPIHKHHEQV